MIAAIKNSDDIAFKQAFMEMNEKVYYYFLKKTKDTEDARDLLQVTFLKLWQYRKSLCEDFNLDQHLFNIARTVFIDHIRKQATLKNTVIKAAEKADEMGSFQPNIVFDLKRQLSTAMEGMPPVRKEVFRLGRLEGYSYYEISQILAISEKAVDNHLSKALKHLRKAFIAFSWLAFLF